MVICVIDMINFFLIIQCVVTFSISRHPFKILQALILDKYFNASITFGRSFNILALELKLRVHYKRKLSCIQGRTGDLGSV